MKKLFFVTLTGGIFTFLGPHLHAHAERFRIETGRNLDDSRFDGLSIDFTIYHDGKDDFLQNFWLVYQRPRGGSQESFGPLSQVHLKSFYRANLRLPHDLNTIESAFVIEVDQEKGVPSLARKAETANRIIGRIALYPKSKFAILLKSSEDSIEPLAKKFRIHRELDTEALTYSGQLKALALNAEDSLHVLHNDHFFEECRDSVAALEARRKRIKESLKKAQF